uniref:ORF_04L n=1 Tax=Human herpesvirus 1 (strain R15) TaxID=36345 RepID=Q6VB69_HHV1R|nr:ORF_04L [Human alphaherpesvirus 1 strain R-15]
MPCGAGRGPTRPHAPPMADGADGRGRGFDQRAAATGPARSRARRQCSHFALIIYIYWDEVRTLRVLTSFTRRPRPLGAVPPAGQWGGGKAGGPWAARRPVGPGVRRAGPGARGRPTGARGSYLITAEPGSRGPGPAPCPFLVSMRNGSGNRRIGR